MGGFPEATRRTPRRRTAFFDSYLSTLIERDVLELASIERRGDLLKLIALLAGRAGGLLAPAVVAHLSGTPRTTLVRYLELLASVFLIKTIPAWSSGQTRRAVGTPKLAFVDTGIACHLIGQDPVRLGEPDGRVIGVEVKAGATVRTEDLAGLRNLAGHLGDRFVAGYVLYTG